MNIHIFTIICLFQPSESMNLKVAGRVRPMTESENSKGSKRIVKAAGSNITIDASNKVDILQINTYFLFKSIDEEFFQSRSKASHWILLLNRMQEM